MSNSPAGINLFSPVIVPCWSAPENVKAFSTTREGGGSRPPYDSFNLALHVGDEEKTVWQNREELRLPTSPLWLKQTHSTLVVEHDGDTQQAPVADASFSKNTGHICAVMTADCLPILLCSEAGDKVAAVHAGWRGLAKGIISSVLAKLSAPSNDILAWLGPAIGPGRFEVGMDVVRAFETRNNSDSRSLSAFQEKGDGKWLADIYSLARMQLERAGVTQIYGGDYCTHSDEQRFFSYRRDGVTGRQGSFIWFE